jgi:hypothetical protein
MCKLPLGIVVVCLATACGSSKNLAGQAGQAGEGGQAGQGGRAGAGGHAGGGARGNAGAGGASRMACPDTATTQPATNACHSAAECGPIGPVVCCTTGNCWPNACPFPPLNCPTDSTVLQCKGTQDCDAGGTCVTTTSGCPQCPHSGCHYPPPPCTQSPDNCGPSARCQPDGGTCVALLCTQGYACSADDRCSVGNPAADAHGCAPAPCNDGWTCAPNTRCTAPSAPVNHGCTPLPCTNDRDCDCGFCVNGACASNLGLCSSPPV